MEDFICWRFGREHLLYKHSSRKSSFHSIFDGELILFGDHTRKFVNRKMVRKIVINRNHAEGWTCWEVWRRVEIIPNHDVEFAEFQVLSIPWAFSALYDVSRQVDLADRLLRKGSVLYSHCTIYKRFRPRAYELRTLGTRETIVSISIRPKMTDSLNERIFNT